MNDKCDKCKNDNIIIADDIGSLCANCLLEIIAKKIDRHNKLLNYCIDKKIY
jgi:hypothetical protein